MAVDPREMGVLPGEGNGHVREAPAGADETPELGGRTMAENRMFAARQDRGQPERTLSDCWMANRVDPAMKHVKPTSHHAMCNRVAGEADRHELRMGDHAVLAGGDGGDPLLYPVGVRFVGYST